MSLLASSYLSFSLVSVVFTNQPYKISVFISVTAQFALVLVASIVFLRSVTSYVAFSSLCFSKCEYITSFFYNVFYSAWPIVSDVSVTRTVADGVYVKTHTRENSPVFSSMVAVRDNNDSKLNITIKCSTQAAILSSLKICSELLTSNWSIFPKGSMQQCPECFAHKRMMCVYLQSRPLCSAAVPT